MTSGCDLSLGLCVAVNALLTQLDQLKRYPNVMVLTTSNITEAIDVAFVDRADIKVCPFDIPFVPSFSSPYPLLPSQRLSRHTFGKPEKDIQVGQGCLKERSS